MNPPWHSLRALSHALYEPTTILFCTVLYGVPSDQPPVYGGITVLYILWEYINGVGVIMVIPLMLFQYFIFNYRHYYNNVLYYIVSSLTDP